MSVSNNRNMTKTGNNEVNMMMKMSLKFKKDTYLKTYGLVLQLNPVLIKMCCSRKIRSQGESGDVPQGSGHAQTHHQHPLCFSDVSGSLIGWRAKNVCPKLKPKPSTLACLISLSELE